MRIIRPSFKIRRVTLDALEDITDAGATCYKSIPESAEKFVAKIIKSGHESVIEHACASVLIICDRGVSHEIVRHRLASYSQESTRYCNYSKDKFGNEITVVKPCFYNEGGVEYSNWKLACMQAEEHYFNLIDAGSKPEEARSVLPNSLKTEIVMTCNLREWRHFFKLRTSKAAHPQMREIARLMLGKFKCLVPVIFDDIVYEP
jgi:thymidylate synthase (FAD)